MIERKQFDEHQKEVIDFINNGSGSLLVNARAGSGKTTVIVEALKEVPETERVLYIAYNLHIVNKIKEMIPETPRIKICTYHSLGLGILYSDLKKDIKINEFKYEAYITKHVNTLSNNESKNMNKTDLKNYIRNILELCNYARYNYFQSAKEMTILCEKYGIEPIYNEEKAVVKVLEWGSSHINEIDFTDMVWLPIELNLPAKNFKFDWEFIDEVQDSSPIQQELFKKCLKSNGRRIMVGDENQCINAWCGADTSAFEKLKKLENTEQKNLPISHRCSEAVIKFAQTIVKDINVSNHAKKGEVEVFKHLKDVKEGDMILCRINEPLIRLYFKFISKGKRAYIIGRKIGKNILELISDTGEKKLAYDLEGKGVIPHLYYNFFTDIERKIETLGISKDSICELPEVVNKLDEIRMIETIAKEAKDLDKLKKMVEKMFIADDNEEEEDIHNKDRSDMITLSSIHRAKGLESDNVFLACPSIWKSPFARSPMELKSEENLKYVSITRAKNNFYYLYEEDIAPSTLWGNKDIIRAELKRVKENIEKNYGKIEPYIPNNKKTKNFSVKKDKENSKVKENKKKKPKFTNYL